MGHRPPRQITTRRQRLFGPDLEPIEVVSFEPRETVEEAKKEFVRGNIDAFELERRVALALKHEPADKAVIPMDQMDRMDMDTVVQGVKGTLAIIGTVAAIAVIFSIVLMGVAGLIYAIAQSV